MRPAGSVGDVALLERIEDLQQLAGDFLFRVSRERADQIAPAGEAGPRAISGGSAVAEGRNINDSDHESLALSRTGAESAC